MNIFEKPFFFFSLAAAVMLLSLTFFKSLYGAKEEALNISSDEIVEIKCADHALRIRFRDIADPVHKAMPSLRCEKVVSMVSPGATVEVIQLGRLVVGIKAGDYVVLDPKEKMAAHRRSMAGFGIFVLFVSIVFFLFGLHLAKKDRQE